MPFTSPSARTAATQILDLWLRSDEGVPLDRTVSLQLRERTWMNGATRRQVSEAVYSTVRLLRRQEYVLNSREIPVSAESLISLWEECGGELPAEITPSQDALRIQAAYSDKMADELEALLGDEALVAANAFNQQAPTCLRVNSILSNRDRIVPTLPCKPCHFSPIGVQLSQRLPIGTLPAYRRGFIELQEEGSQLLALLTLACADQIVVDVGAGGGGKSLALAAMMQNKGRILALDVSQSRLNELERRAKKAKVEIIEPICLSSNPQGTWAPTRSQIRKMNHFMGLSNIVLVDAPCSGSGTLRRSPDKKWRGDIPESYNDLQLAILKQSSPFVPTDGTMLYATCAIERCQNEELVQMFLETPEGASFVVEPMEPRLRQALSPSNVTEDEVQSFLAGPYVRTWPHRHNMDGFFVAALKRSKQPVLEE